jgi:ABC-type multidrug transport system fused ATPase/permease subunit
LSLAAGAAIGFVGANGSGKTTLVDVLAGLLLPQSGQVEVDGITLDDTNRSAWQSTIAYVPQHVFLLDATVAVTECVACLPNGYDEVLGERGCRLSGGQRQRLGIARALYRDASLLILDEATSALDAVAEEEIGDMLETLRPRRTVLMIAHQLSALRHCDVIHEIRNGRIVRSGTYREFQGAMRARTLNPAERQG